MVLPQTLYEMLVFRSSDNQAMAMYFHVTLLEFAECPYAHPVLILGG